MAFPALAERINWLVERWPAALAAAAVAMLALWWSGRRTRRGR